MQSVGTSPRVTQIEEQTQRLGSIADTLHTKVNSLRQRLGPVLSPQPIAPTDTSPQPLLSMVPLASTLSAIGDVLCVVGSELREINEALEL